MANNSDFLLLFGVQGGGSIEGDSGSNIYKDLNSIVKTVEEQITTRLQFSADANSLAAMVRQVEEAFRSAKLTIDTTELEASLAAVYEKNDRKQKQKSSKPAPIGNGAASSKAAQQNDKETKAAEDLNRKEKERNSILRDREAILDKIKHDLKENEELLSFRLTGNDRGDTTKAVAKIKNSSLEAVTRTYGVTKDGELTHYETIDTASVSKALNTVHKKFETIRKEKEKLFENSKSKDFFKAENAELNEAEQTINDIYEKLRQLDGESFTPFTHDKKSIESYEDGVKLYNDLIDEYEQNFKSKKTIIPSGDIEDIQKQATAISRLYKEASSFGDIGRLEIFTKEDVDNIRIIQGAIDKINSGSLKDEGLREQQETLAHHSRNATKYITQLNSAITRETTIRSKENTAVNQVKNTYIQTNKIYAEAKRYYDENASGINANIQLQQKWASLMKRINAGDFGMDTQSARMELAELQTQTKLAGAETTTLHGKLKKLFHDHFGSQFATLLIGAGIMQIRQMYIEVTEIDKAMTELKKVTNLTAGEYKKFGEVAADVARKVGGTIADTINATADFARLGYNVDDATMLAEAALVYKNVGDGIEDIATASEAIISTMKAFDIGAERSMSIVDKYNEIGNRFAISSVGIGEALQRSAAALAAAGNTIDESIALATAANSVIQDPDVVGRLVPTLKIAISVKLRRRTRPSKDLCVLFSTKN